MCFGALVLVVLNFPRSHSISQTPCASDVVKPEASSSAMRRFQVACSGCSVKLGSSGISASFVFISCVCCVFGAMVLAGANVVPDHAPACDGLKTFESLPKLRKLVSFSRGALAFDKIARPSGCGGRL